MGCGGEEELLLMRKVWQNIIFSSVILPMTLAPDWIPPCRPLLVQGSILPLALM
jgi:hypothetical protein